MNGMGLSLSEICCLFCCPPCPSKIAAKLAFLPPEPTYTFEDEDESRDKQKLHLTDKAEWQYSDREKENLEVISNKIIGKSISLISGVLHTHVARQPDRVHVRQVRAERAVHDPAQPRQRRRPWADEQLLPRAGQ